MSEPNPFPHWGNFNFTSLIDADYCSKITSFRNKFPEFTPDPRMREVPPVKPPGSPQAFDDFFTITFESKGGKIMGLYQARDQYLFASKVLRDGGPPQPFEKLKGIDFLLPYKDIKTIDLHVSYRSLQGTKIPSYKRRDLSYAVTVLARGFNGNDEWGLALATLVGATSDAIKSFGMESHVCRGLNIRSAVNHVPSDRLIRINKNWSNISKSIRSEKYDYVLSYKDENGEDIHEQITRFSAGLILAVINFKDGSKREKNARKLEKQDRGKRKRDENEEKEGEGSKKSTGTSGRKPNKRRKGNVPGTRHNYESVVEAESETPDSSDSSDSDSEATAEDSELQQEFFLVSGHSVRASSVLPNASPEDDKTHSEPKEDNLALFTTSDLISGRHVPASSVLPSASPEDAKTNSEPKEDNLALFTTSDLISGRHVPASSVLLNASPEDDKTLSEPKEDSLVLSSTSDIISGLDVPASSVLPVAAPEENETLAEPKEDRLSLDFSTQAQDNKTEFVQVLKSSKTGLLSGDIVPTSSVLVKHGTKREAEVGDEDSNQAKVMASQTDGSEKNSTDDENQVAGS